MASAQLEMSLAWTEFRSVPNRTVGHLTTFLMVLIKAAGASMDDLFGGIECVGDSISLGGSVDLLKGCRRID